MSRVVWPYLFTLHATGLVEALRTQKVPPVRDKFFPKSPGNVVPIALRWSHTVKGLGLPREPFQVLRRRRNTSEKALFVNVLAQSVPIAPQLSVNAFAGGDLAYVVNAAVTLVAPGTVTLTALDLRSLPIPGQIVTVAGNATIQFRCPGIASLRVSGNGTIGPVSVIPQTAYANLPDWEKIQNVGLPFTKGEIGTFYNTLPQGLEPASLDGVSAAAQRLTITRLLQMDPPGTGIADFPVPAWPLPDPGAYVADVRGAKSLVPMIGRCLKQSVDTDSTKLQKLYVEAVTLDGIKQAGVPGAKADPARPTAAILPVTGLTMLAATTDCWAAVALGYGTIDIPPLPGAAPVDISPPVHPQADTLLLLDYMVTAPFVTPSFSGTLAALSGGHPAVQAPAILFAEIGIAYPPVIRNHAGSAAVKVSWPAASIPQGYGVLASRSPGASEVLNTPRPPMVKGFHAFIGTSPEPPQSSNPSFADVAVLPLKPPASISRYLVAGLDVFGSWSSWVLASAGLSPSPIAKPGLRDVTFLMDPAHAAGHSVPATMRIEFAWDWKDRAPGQIRFTGQFVPPKTNLGPVPILTGFATRNSGLPGSPVLLTFKYSSQAQADTIAPATLVPSIDSAHTTAGPVVIIKTGSPDPNSTQVLYRVDITGITLDFTSVNELDFALYATASEEVRPGEFSDATDPVSGFIGKVVHAFDPIPPTVTFTPPSISWTALPDATGSARGILQWTPDPKAIGYYVWEATESGLRHILAPGAPDPAPDTPLVLRGATLKTLIEANQAASLEGFARLNKQPIAGNRTEIRLPAAASTLYAFRVSAISAGNVEATRSPQVAFFGVPRRNVPGTPRLILRKATAPQTGIQVIALPVGNAAPPAGFRVFRVRRADLSLDPSTMGPPKIGETNPGWHPYASTSLKGKPVNGMSILDTAVTPSWYPYYYRVTAVGAQDLANGLHGGESDYSNTQSAQVFPPGIPLLKALALSVSAGAGLITLTTDLPATLPSPAGPALAELLQMIPDPANPARITAKTILSLATDQIAVGVIKLPPPPPAGHNLPPPIPRFARSAPDGNGQWTLFALLPYVVAQKGSYMLRLTDPLSRRSAASF